MGLVASLNRPGGNATGVNLQTVEDAGSPGSAAGGARSRAGGARLRRVPRAALAQVRDYVPAFQFAPHGMTTSIWRQEGTHGTKTRTS